MKWPDSRGTCSLYCHKPRYSPRNLPSFKGRVPWPIWVSEHRTRHSLIERERRKVNEIEGVPSSEKVGNRYERSIRCHMQSGRAGRSCHGNVKDQSSQSPTKTHTDSHAQERAASMDSGETHFHPLFNQRCVFSSGGPRLSMNGRPHLYRCMPLGLQKKATRSSHRPSCSITSSRPSAAACRSGLSGRLSRRTLEGTSRRRSGAHITGYSDPPSVP